MRLLILNFILFITIALSAQSKMERMPVDQNNLPIVCKGHGENHGHFILPKAAATSRSKNFNPVTFQAVFDEDTPIPAIAAFDFATQILSQSLSSTIPVNVLLIWSTDLPMGSLASAGPSEFVINFPNSVEGTWFPISLAEKIAGEAINNESNPDIVVNVNGLVNWYYDFENPTAISNTQFDFVSIILHELIHGLGFVGFATVTQDGEGMGRIKNNGRPAIYDIYINNSVDGNLCQNVSDPSLELRTAMIGNDLTLLTPQFQGAADVPIIFAPTPYQGGSSIHHLDQRTYQNTPNSLMTPAASRGQIEHDPGLALDILNDLGWSTTHVTHQQMLAIEDVTADYPIIANVNSDIGFFEQSLQLHYSFNNFTNTTTLDMVSTGNQNEFTATIPAPGVSTSVQYYFTIVDARNIRLSFPALAPDPIAYRTFYLEDTEAPELEHTPLINIDDRKTLFTLEAIASDFFTGIDSVYAEYFINGVPQPTVKLIPNFEDDFRINLFVADIELENSLSAGDILEYRITASDNSIARNTTILPSTGFFTIDIIQTFDAVTFYSNEFSVATLDFDGNGFSEIIPIGFGNNAIHSEHPYSAAGQGQTFNFNYQLKVPIIIQDQNPIIEFDEIVLVEPGEPGTTFLDPEFWDFVIVEGRKADDSEWLPLIDGYDARDNTRWLNAYNSSITAAGNSSASGEPSLYEPRTINMLESGNFQVGQEIFIRFRLFSDPQISGWGWAIDNLRIQDTQVSVEDFISNSNFQIFPNPVSNEIITVNASFQQPVRDLQLKVYDSFGRLVEQRTFENEQDSIQETISAQEYLSGVYFVTLQINGRELLGKKVVVE